MIALRKYNHSRQFACFEQYKQSEGLSVCFLW